MSSRKHILPSSKLDDTTLIMIMFNNQVPFGQVVLKLYYYFFTEVTQTQITLLFAQVIVAAIAGILTQMYV